MVSFSFTLIMLFQNSQHNWSVKMKLDLRKLKITFVIPISLTVSIMQSDAALIDANGGITLFISYDNLDDAGWGSWNNKIIQVDSIINSSDCEPTNIARANLGEPSSSGSCLVGDTCFGREKLTGDIRKLAEYIFQSTHGTHYLKQVNLADNGRLWNNADVRWNIGPGSSVAINDGWTISGLAIDLNGATRRCIHDVAHHELGHYFYNLPDRYAGGTSNNSVESYYEGSIRGSSNFNVSIDVGDPNSVMSGNFPHRFVDSTNARLTVSYNSGSGLVAGEMLTPQLLEDSSPNNNGPDRAHHGFTMPFAQDEWSVLPDQHADLTGVHTEGVFSEPDLALMPDVDIRLLGDGETLPGTILLLDRSGSMSVTTDGIPASQLVQESGMYLYHSMLAGEYVGTQLYNDIVETLFDYDEYNINNQLLSARFRTASGSTNIAAAIESAIDTLIAEHGNDGVTGSQIVLMSDGVQTTGANLWDQVTRAMDKGIKIHTISFGQADTETMEAIASSSDGEVFRMAEATSGAELKLGMNRKLSELRGFTPLYFYKGKLKVNKSDKVSQFHEGMFTIPNNNRALQFYVFSETGNASTLSLELEDSKGNIHNAIPLNVANKGRLNGVTVEKPLPGKWIYRIKGSGQSDGILPQNTDYEIIAQVMNNNLDTHVNFFKVDSKLGGEFKIEATLKHRYPLTDLDAVANLYRDNHLLASINLNDDGKYSDQQSLDGVYSGLVDPKQLNVSPDQTENLRMDIVFTTSDQTVPAPNSHYESGTKWAELKYEYTKIAKTNFKVYKSKIIDFNNNDVDEPNLSIIEPTTPSYVKRGGEGKFQVVIDNAFISKLLLKISLGQGIETQIVDIVPADEAFSSRVSINYKVSESAIPGERDLLLQSNHINLKHSDVLTVTL